MKIPQNPKIQETKLIMSWIRTPLQENKRTCSLVAPALACLAPPTLPLPNLLPTCSPWTASPGATKQPLPLLLAGSGECQPANSGSKELRLWGSQCSQTPVHPRACAPSLAVLPMGSELRLRSPQILAAPHRCSRAPSAPNSCDTFL